VGVLKAEILEIRPQDLSDMIFGSFRYAIGRRTYFVSIACDLIRRWACHLPQRDIELMIREIDYEAKRGALGDSCDRESWTALFFFLEGLLPEGERRWKLSSSPAPDPIAAPPATDECPGCGRYVVMCLCSHDDD
jgi:hypothetical protein